MNYGGAVLVGLGLCLVLLPARTFHARGAAIKPLEQTSVLVRDGVSSPLVAIPLLGMVLTVLGVATLLRGAIPFIAPVALGAVLYLRFIRFEERALEQTFGDDYRDYRARVRTWL